MKKFFIFATICICICLLTIPALAAEDEWDGDIYSVGDDTAVISLPEPVPVPEPEPVPEPLPAPPAPIAEPVPEPLPVPPAPPAPIAEPVPEPLPVPPAPPAPIAEPVPAPTLVSEKLPSVRHIGIPMYQSEPQWAFCSEILSRGRLAPADVQLSMESSGEVRIVKLGSKLYFPGLKPGYKVILVDLTSMKITQIVDRPMFVDKPAGKTLAILVDESLVFYGSAVITG